MSKIEETTSEQLAAKLETGEPLTAIEGKTAAGLMRIAAKVLSGKKGRPKKFESDAERYAFHNAEKKKKRKANREEI